MLSLPIDQGGIGRHKCAACAYEKGYQDGLNHKEIINLESILSNLEESQEKGNGTKVLMQDMQKDIMTALLIATKNRDKTPIVFA